MARGSMCDSAVAVYTAGLADHCYAGTVRYTDRLHIP
jgi:hypothetical protein